MLSITILLLTITSSHSFTHNYSQKRHLFKPHSPTFQKRHTTCPSPPNNRQKQQPLNSFLDDHYFLIEGIVTGIVLNVATSASRIVSAQDGWEERIRASRMATSSSEQTELDLMAAVSEVSPSRYGPDAERQRDIRTLIAAGQYDETKEKEDFEDMYGLKFDPYYDVPYDEDELPTDVSFNTDPFFGDRVYEDGEMFFKDGKVFYRKGSRPRMKFFWE